MYNFPSSIFTQIPLNNNFCKRCDMNNYVECVQFYNLQNMRFMVFNQPILFLYSQ